MDTWPTVAALIPTYNRSAIVRRTVELLFAHILYPGPLRIFVGCDGTDDTPDALADSGATVLAQPAGGIGANLNRLIRQAQAERIDYYISLDDDHHLVAPLDLKRHVRKLMTDLSAGRIHLLMEAKNDEHYDWYKFIGNLDKDHYWRIWWSSPEHFLMSFRANLTHRRWWEVMGLLPEGLRTGQTEWNYAKQCKDIGNSGAGVDVFVPLTAPGAETWEHNNGGISWNQQGL
jgi:glycosyltransferase involved in cell wall biosynthesis